MNKAQLVGIVVIIIVIVLHLTFENDATDFLVGFFGGGGLGILFTNNFGKRNKHR